MSRSVEMPMPEEWAALYPEYTHVRYDIWAMHCRLRAEINENLYFMPHPQTGIPTLFVWYREKHSHPVQVVTWADEQGRHREVTDEIIEIARGADSWARLGDGGLAKQKAREEARKKRVRAESFEFARAKTRDTFDFLRLTNDKWRVDTGAPLVVSMAGAKKEATVNEQG